MEDNYIIIHGSFGSPFSNWIPWLRKEIDSRELKVYTPNFPTGIGYQNYDNWARVLKAYVDANDVNENTTIFAHSIAPIFVCKFLVENNIKIKKLVSVCGFNNYSGINVDYDEVNKTMFFDDYAKVKEHCKEIICYYTNNDPYVSFECEKEFADTISNKQVIIPKGGHLNSESGYREFKDLIKEI